MDRRRARGLLEDIVRLLDYDLYKDLFADNGDTELVEELVDLIVLETGRE